MENLFQSQAAATDLLSQTPAYLLAADNHNIGNSLGGSWFDPSTWETKFDNSGKFIASSVLSGAASVYNSFATVGNWLGADAEMINTQKWISATFDDDMGKYYAENRQAIDLAGFIGTSFIPGLAGMKLLNMGQAALKAGIVKGYIGENLASATGLLVPRTQMYVDLAAKDIIASTATFSRINNNIIKALGSGFHQNVLEAAAFETMVQATMFKSSVLEDQSKLDVVKNIAFGGLVGGVIGGSFEAARTFGAVKKQVIAANPESKLFSARAQLRTATPESQRIILNAEDRDLSAVPVNVEGSNFDVNKKLYADRVERTNLAIRSDINAMGRSGDVQLTNMVADAVHNLDHMQMLSNFAHSEAIGRVSSEFAIERKLGTAIKNLDVDAAKNLHVRYVKLTGEGIGDVVDEAPRVLNIADTVIVKAGASSEQAVLGVVGTHKFSVDKLWSAASLIGKDAHLVAEARNIWANSVLSKIKSGTKIAYDDFPLLERALKDKQLDIKIVMPDGLLSSPVTERDLVAHLMDIKPKVAQQLLESKVLTPGADVSSYTEEVAKIVNMKLSALEGSVDSKTVNDYFARQSANEAHKQFLVTKGLKSDSDAIPDIAFMPTTAKIAYRVPESVGASDGNIANSLVWFKQQQALFQQSADNVFTFVAGGEIAKNAPKLPDRILHKASAYNETAGLVSYANGGYNSPVAIAQQIGANVTRPLKEAMRKETQDVLEGPLVSLGNKQVAAIEFEVLNNKMAATTEQYVLDTDGVTGELFALVSKKIRDYKLKGDTNLPPPVLQQGAEEYLLITHEETYRALAAHIGRDSNRTSNMRQIHSAQGHSDEKFSDVFRPVRPSSRDYPFVAFVKDTKITGAGHTTMIHAASEKELLALADKVPTDKGYKVLYKSDAENYYKARDEYDYARTLNENYIDSEMKSRGINSQFFQRTDPQTIVNSILQQHLRADDVLATELVRLKYQPQMDWLADQGAQYSKVESSKYGSSLSKIEKTGTNPYTDITKTMLDVSKVTEYPLLHSFNKSLDTAVSKTYGVVRDLFTAAKTPKDLEAVNKHLQDAGYNNAYADAATLALVNHTAPKAELSKFVRTSNSILSFFTLGSDMLNGINNAIGANILRGTELHQLTNAIKKGDTVLADELAKLAKIQLPGTGDLVLSPAKLIARANKSFLSEEGKTLIAQYEQEGLIKTGLQQFKSIQDDFTLQGTETVTNLNSRIDRAFAKAKEFSGDIAATGRKYSGNDFFEKYNRFISANVMHQLTDLAESAGLLTGAESRAYRNTFVNRVEGNTIASQRPIIFQGPIGQAVGLFQSYQFNLMQQLFRYVGEGTSKDAAMLIGLQGTLYGINGLPAFNFINTHIVGNLSGNKNHTDLYDATYGIAGKTAGDFLMYGIPSSITQTNIYSRGDINPRQLTIIPNSLAQVPVVGAYGKFFSNIKDTVDKIGAGGNVWQSVLQGIEHNGISRPLAGIAQVAQSLGPEGKVFSTTTKGDILYSNDLMSLATLSRLAGGRPIDEAIINDGVYRVTAYEAAQSAKRKLLTEAVKTTGIAGQVADDTSILAFSEAHAATGGKSAQFNKWMLKEYMTANTPRSEKIRSQLSSPFAQKMQILMEGRSTGYGSE